MNKILFSLQDICGFSPNQLLSDLSSDKLFIGELLCVSKKHRGRGIGRILAAKSIELARSELCDSYAVLATSNYSQRIYKELGFDLLREAFYDAFRDEDGAKIINDHQEHKSAKCLYLNLNQSPSE